MSSRGREPEGSRTRSATRRKHGIPRFARDDVRVSFAFLSGFLRTSFRRPGDPLPMDDRRRARRFAVLAVAALLGLGALAARGRAEETLLAFAAFVAFGGCRSRAGSLFHCDEILFERRKRRRPALKLLVIGTLAALLASHARAQQTIFNVPSADVLDPGKVSLATDELFRPTAPKFSSTTIRGVVGVFPHVEAGVNFGGFVSPGSILPTATVAVKSQ